MRSKLVILTAFLIGAGIIGCTPEQRANVAARYQSDLDKAKITYAATTQATAQADAVVKDAQAYVDTLPAGTAKDKAAAVLAKAEEGLTQARKVEDEASAVLVTAQNLATSISSGAPLDTSPLAVFGPYGALAGLVITTAWGIYNQLDKSGLLAKLEGKQKELDQHKDALAAVAGTTNPIAALAPAPPAAVA
jgi:hypothetical protein